MKYIIAIDEIFRKTDDTISEFTSKHAKKMIY